MQLVERAVCPDVILNSADAAARKSLSSLSDKIMNMQYIANAKMKL